MTLLTFTLEELVERASLYTVSQKREILKVVVIVVKNFKALGLVLKKKQSGAQRTPENIKPFRFLIERNEQQSAEYLLIFSS